jgi:hypothetical protein
MTSWCRSEVAIGRCTQVHHPRAVFRRPYAHSKVGLIEVLRDNAVSSFLRFNPLIRIRILLVNPYLHIVGSRLVE